MICFAVNCEIEMFTTQKTPPFPKHGLFKNTDPFRQTTQKNSAFSKTLCFPKSRCFSSNDQTKLSVDKKTTHKIRRCGTKTLCFTCADLPCKFKNETPCFQKHGVSKLAVFGRLTKNTLFWRTPCF